MKRIFLAIDLPRELKDKIALFQKTLRYLPDIKWVKPENLHLTLVFLGWLKQSERKRVGEIAQEEIGKIESFPLCLKGLGVFPEIRRAKILWIGADGGLRLKLVNRTLFRKLGEAGFKIDDREFTPHITIGRTKEKLNKENILHTLNSYKEREFGRFMVEQVEIMESELKREGPVYKVIKSIKLQKKEE